MKAIALWCAVGFVLALVAGMSYLSWWVNHPTSPWWAYFVH